MMPDRNLQLKRTKNITRKQFKQNLEQKLHTLPKIKSSNPKHIPVEDLFQKISLTVSK